MQHELQISPVRRHTSSLLNSVHKLETRRKPRKGLSFLQVESPVSHHSPFNVLRQQLALILDWWELVGVGQGHFPGRRSQTVGQGHFPGKRSQNMPSSSLFSHVFKGSGPPVATRPYQVFTVQNAQRSSINTCPEVARVCLLYLTQTSRGSSANSSETSYCSSTGFHRLHESIVQGSIVRIPRAVQKNTGQHVWAHWAKPHTSAASALRGCTKALSRGALFVSKAQSKEHWAACSGSLVAMALD